MPPMVANERGQGVGASELGSIHGGGVAVPLRVLCCAVLCSALTLSSCASRSVLFPRRQRHRGGLSGDDRFHGDCSAPPGGAPRWHRCQGGSGAVQQRRTGGAGGCLRARWRRGCPGWLQGCGVGCERLGFGLGVPGPPLPVNPVHRLWRFTPHTCSAAPPLSHYCLTHHAGPH